MASALVDSIGIEDNALETLYATFAEPLRKFCRSRLEGRQDEAEDACHETLLRASIALPGFRTGEPLWPWLATIAANVCKDMTRNDRRFGGELDLDAPDPSAAPEEELDRRDRAAIVVAAMGTVPLHYRKALYLREWEEWSWADIARIEGKSVASVRSTLMRARRVLRSSIRQEAERVHQWPLPTVTPRGWARPFLRFRQRMAQWYPSASAPERTLALLPVPALEWLAGMIAGGGAAIVEGGVALVLAVSVAHGAAAVVPPAGVGAGGTAVSAEAKAEVSLADGGVSTGAQGAVGGGGWPDWFYNDDEPVASVPIGDGGVRVVSRPNAWGNDQDGDGSKDYFTPYTVVLIVPPSETGPAGNALDVEHDGYPGTYMQSTGAGAHCQPPERNPPAMMGPTCDALALTT